MKINPYLNFDGNAEEAFIFYKSVFGGNFTRNVKMKDMPDSDKLSKEEQEYTMHISLPIGEDTILMASDECASQSSNFNKGNNVYLSIHPDSREEADRLFKELSKGGKVEMPMEDQFWGDYFGSFTDKFGIRWMINYSEEKREYLKI